MSLSYRTRYGYESIVEPTRLFSDKESATAYDLETAVETIVNYADHDELRALAAGEGSKKVLAAMAWFIGAHEDAEYERILERQRAEQKAKDVFAPLPNIADDDVVCGVAPVDEPIKHAAE